MDTDKQAVLGRAKVNVTTVKVNGKTKERIELLRSYKRESYDDILQKILEVLNICRANPEKARGRLILIDKERKRNLGGEIK